MEIVGTGFLARHLRPLSGTHRDVPAVDQLGFGDDYYLRVLDAASDQHWSTHAFSAR
jgi:hypothetical protein